MKKILKWFSKEKQAKTVQQEVYYTPENYFKQRRKHSTSIVRDSSVWRADRYNELVDQLEEKRNRL